MSSIEKLKKFRQKIDDLYDPIRANLTRISELDKECLEKQQFVEQLAVPIIQNWTKSKRDLRHKRYRAIKTALEKMEQISNEKVRIAAQSYEAIDSHVIQLDKLYAKITQQKIKKIRAIEKPKSKKNRRKSEVVIEPEVKFDPTNFVDMPIDPSEPTYCLCHQVSFGQMVCCDNKNCPIEWFHFDCVGLKAEPKGKWFCGTCTERINKK